MRETIEKQIIQSLYDNDFQKNGMFSCFDQILDDVEISKKELRPIMKSMRERGLVEYANGLMTDDGEVAGSGYRATEEGLKIYPVEI